MARYAGCDDDSNWIAGAFPRLRHLAIRHQNHLTLRTTWRTLPSVLTRCAGIEELEINLHVPNFFPHEAALWDTTLPSLRVLKFQRLFIQKADIDPFVYYLAKLCPRVKELGIVSFYELYVVQVTIGGRRRGHPMDRRLDEIEIDVFIRKFCEYQANGSTMEEMFQGGADGG